MPQAGQQSAMESWDRLLRRNRIADDLAYTAVVRGEQVEAVTVLIDTLEEHLDTSVIETVRDQEDAVCLREMAALFRRALAHPEQVRR